jgi:hypothetical protein
MAQVDANGRNLKPASAAKLLVLSDFCSILPFESAFSFFAS